MESPSDYFSRKREELDLLAGLLARPPVLPEPHSIEEAAELKFRLAAAIKAERALQDWDRTETAWTVAGASRRIGLFELRSDYQRADLKVSGPPIYGTCAGWREIATIYSACGMAGVSTVLQALGQVMPEARLCVPAGAYDETRESVERFYPTLRLEAYCEDGRPRSRLHRRVLLLDSSSPSIQARPGPGSFDLVLFDTTCFSAGSGRIGRILSWARSLQVPIVLLRSHTKLDSFGIEYGRLGSAVLLAPDTVDRTRFAWAGRLEEEIRRAVRLFGVAPVPASLPPFTGTPAYMTLERRRLARIIANGRRITRTFRRWQVPVSTYGHGLYAVLRARGGWPLQYARDQAGRLTAELASASLPVRHAGSFGFDFFALDGYPDRAGGFADRFGVRLAFSDSPSGVADELAGRIARWWLHNVTQAPALRRAEA